MPMGKSSHPRLSSHGIHLHNPPSSSFFFTPEAQSTWRGICHTWITPDTGWSPKRTVGSITTTRTERKKPKNL